MLPNMAPVLRHGERYDSGSMRALAARHGTFDRTVATSVLRSRAPSMKDSETPWSDGYKFMALICRRKLRGLVI